MRELKDQNKLKDLIELNIVDFKIFLIKNIKNINVDNEKFINKLYEYYFNTRLSYRSRKKSNNEISGYIGSGVKLKRSIASFIRHNKENKNNSSVVSLDYWRSLGWETEEDILRIREKISKIQKKNYGICVDGFIEDGLTQEEAEEKVRVQKEKAYDASRKKIKQIKEKDPTFYLKNSNKCKEYYLSKGYEMEDAIRLSSDNLKNMQQVFYDKVRKNPEEYKDRTGTTLNYWLKKTDGDEEEAKRLLKERQTTFSLDKCIAKFGEEDGKRRWQIRQEKWMKNNKKSNFSKVSQKLFYEIYNKLNIDKSKIYFATLHREENRKNSEYILQLNNITIKPDFIDLNQNKIIEFDGLYWHNQHTKANKKREETRDKEIIESGFKVLHILESDYYKDKNEIVKKCLEFLNN